MTPKACSEIFDYDLCVAATCEWDNMTMSCFNDTHLSCDKYDERSCPGNRCVYDLDFGLCRTFDCPDLSSPSQCDSSALGCVFNTTFGVCVEKGEKVPCAVFNFDKSDCPLSYCKYADDVDVCYSKTGKIPCTQIYEEGACDTRNHCTWNKGLLRCEGKPVKDMFTNLMQSVFA